jgi:uncharacterized UPF0146 family protein
MYLIFWILILIKGLKMWNDFAQYIMNEVGDEPVTIAEIAVGKFDRIADELSRKDNITIIKTDISPKDSTVIKDDITNPNLKLYENVDLIYSIRPPSELQPHLVKLACEIDSQLIIKPLTNEDLNTGRVKMKLKNFNRASFYILK